MAHAGGRPTKYNKGMIKKAEEYLKGCVEGLAKVKTVITDEETGKEIEVFASKVFAVNLPSLAGLSLFLGVSRETIDIWSKSHSEFSDVVERLRCLQEQRLMEGGISGRYNPTITKLVLHKHGYRDSSELSGPNGKDLIPDKDSKGSADVAIDIYLADMANKKSKNE